VLRTCTYTYICHVPACYIVHVCVCVCVCVNAHAYMCVYIYTPTYPNTQAAVPALLALYHGEDWLESNCWSPVFEKRDLLQCQKKPTTVSKESNCWSPVRQFPCRSAAAWHVNSNVARAALHVAARAALNALRADVSAQNKNVTLTPRSIFKKVQTPPPPFPQSSTPPSPSPPLSIKR
jgi:hypothetical protein